MELLARALEIILPVLEVLLLILLLNRNLFRKYLLVFLYCSLQLATSLAEIIVLQTQGNKSETYRYLYWSDEMLTDAFLFVMVAVMIYRATEGTTLRRVSERLFSGVVVVALLLPFAVFDKPFSNHWFTRSSQLLNFGGAILNLLLWTALLGMHKRDPLLLTVSSGLGVTVTGSAVFYGLLATYRKNTDLTPFLTLGYVFCRVAGLAIWCWAFWPGRMGTQLPPPDAPASPHATDEHPAEHKV